MRIATTLDGTYGNQRGPAGLHLTRGDGLQVQDELRSDDDRVLAELCRMLIERDLFKIGIYNKAVSKNQISSLRKNFADEFRISKKDASYFINEGKLSNSAYELANSNINVLMKNGDIVDIASASDLPNIKALSKIVNKYYLCFPKSVSL